MIGFYKIPTRGPIMEPKLSYAKVHVFLRKYQSSRYINRLIQMTQISYCYIIYNTDKSMAIPLSLMITNIIMLVLPLKSGMRLISR